jgi:hypothetical protein
MRPLSAAALMTCAGLAQALAAPPVEPWRVAGLANPYSAQFEPIHNVVFVSNLVGEPLAKDGSSLIVRIGFRGRCFSPTGSPA